MCNLYSITSSQSYVRELARTLRDITGKAFEQWITYWI
jgi:hypothetical protein